MHGVVDADTHIAEPEAMWQLIDEKMAPRRPVLVELPKDTVWRPQRPLADRRPNLSQASGQG